jgi:hypothetical protein
MALCNDGHGSARRHRDLNGCGERFEFPRGSRPPGTPGGCVTELLLGLKTPLVEKGPVPRRATPAANGIGVAAPALAGMPDRIKVEPVTGSCQSRPCHGRLMPKRRHLIVVGSRSPIVPGSPLRTLLTRRGPIKVGVWRGGVRPGIAVPAPFVWRCLSGAAVAPFPHPPHRTGHADLPHPALGQDLTPSSTARRAQADSGVRARSARRGARVDSSRPFAA